MIAKEFPGKVFETRAELFKSLKENKQLLIDAKKAAVKFSDSMSAAEIRLNASKMDVPAGKVAAVINTTGYMDSHNDVHIAGIWNKSITDNQGKLYYVMDHELSIDKVIIYPNALEAKVMDVDWSEVGASYDGKTQALVYLFDKSDIVSDDARKAIERKAPVQNSVRMQYVGYQLAMNSDDSDHKEEKTAWDLFYPSVANKERADEQGYFWAITEAKIYKEGSMVLHGSNDITPMNYGKQEPGQPTPQHKNEPPVGTHTSKTIFF